MPMHVGKARFGELFLFPRAPCSSRWACVDSQRPDLIICDIQMLHLDGHAVLKAPREDRHRAHIPAIAVTAT